jgi:hypothetical protein
MLKTQEVVMKKMGRPPVDTASITLRLHKDMIALIDDARRKEEDIPTRPEMIRRVLEAWAASKE